MRKAILFARSPQLRAVIERADELMTSADFRPSKSEGRTLAGIIRVPDAGYAFIKRTDTPAWSSALYDRIRGSRAARALKGAAMLEQSGIAHPQPLAAMDIIERGGVRASYLISSALTDADTLSRFALGPGGVKGRDVARRKAISDAVAAAVRQLHEGGLYTRDLQETNLMIEAQGKNDEPGSRGFKVYFIDLEDFRRTRQVSHRRRMLNLVHLDRSIGRFLSRAARLSFLYAYLGGRPGRAQARRLVTELLATRARIDWRKSRRAPSARRAAATTAGETS